MLSNMSLAVFLVKPDDVRCISVAYDGSINSKGEFVPTTKDVKSFKSFDKGIKKDDLVVVPTETRIGFTVGKVVGVDLDVDYGSSEKMRWIVCPFDTENYDTILKGEEGMAAAVRHAEVQDERKKLAEKMAAINPNFGDNPLLQMTAGTQKTTFVPEPPARGGAQANVPPTPAAYEGPYNHTPQPAAMKDDEFPF